MAKAKKKSNAGRKPGTDNKEEIKLFVEGSKVRALGGKEGVRDVSYKAINKAVEQSKNAK
jgi:hypothetical protein